MAPEILYLLKVNIAIALFYAFYRLLFHKDTFFQWRRIALLSFLVLSLVYPLLNIQDWIKSQEPMVAMTDIYAAVILPEVEIIPDSELTSTSWHTIILTSLRYIYTGVCLFMLIRIIVQLFVLIRLDKRTKIRYIGNTKVHILSDGAAPFSFFKWIFMNPDEHQEDELREILTHELTHARQWHSIDVIFSELICIICWFNPFMWLLKREIRGNLEYLADHKVLEKGYDSKTYQYHLLGLAHQTKLATLYNNFNVLPLKKRIKMMNQKRTSQLGATKYFLFPLLAAALLIISNIDAIARTTGAVIEELTTPAPAEAPILVETIETPNNPVNEDTVFEIVESMPEYPGGQAALMKFISGSVKYPETARKNGTQGRVIIQFIVAKDGTIKDPVIVRSVDTELDNEALRIISAMPKWKPGTQRGKAVDVKYTVPVIFKLNDNIKITYKAPNPEGNKPNANTVYEIAEKMPEYPGGQQALMEFLNKNVKYPVDAQKDNIQGRVIIQFIVDKDGTIKESQVVRAVSPSLDAEAVRIVSSMPKWLPGKVGGKNVPVKYTVPVVFRLS